jgi:hypothetical protein
LKRAEKRKEKKTLVLTLGSLPKKGGKKKLVLQDTCIADSASWFSHTTRQEAQTIFCGGFFVCRIRLSGPVPPVN